MSHVENAALPPPSSSDAASSPTPDDAILPNGDAAMRVPSKPSVIRRAVNSVGRKLHASATDFGRWLASPKGRGVLKCTIAYTIASLATFVAPLSDFLGRPDGKHVVATITVYFHASRSAGSMIEAILIASVAVAYAELISILSMATSVIFGSVLGLVTLAHVLVVIVFIGGGFGFMGWVKQKMSNPLVNVGSTLASLAIIGVVTKENAVVDNVFSNHKIVQVFKMLIMGITTAAAVNLLLWRVSARDSLRQSMNRASTSLGQMLSVIASGFLRGAEDDSSSLEKLTAAQNEYAAAYPQVMSNLREAKFERYFLGQEKLYALERSTATAIGTIAKSIGGLRSAAFAQFALLKEIRGRAAEGPFSPGPRLISPLQSRSSSYTATSVDDDVTPFSSKKAGKSPLQTPMDTFRVFVTMMGPHMEALADILSRVLREPPFGDAPDYEVRVMDDVRYHLSDALSGFNISRAAALAELYQMIEQSRSRSDKTKAEFEEIAAACGHFSFSLQSLGEEMQKYLDVVDDLKYVSDHSKLSWRWLLWYRKPSSRGLSMSALPYESADTSSWAKPIRKSGIPRGIPESMVEQRDTFAWRAAPEASRLLATLSQHVLKFTRTLARDENPTIEFRAKLTSKVRFGLKVGIGASLWAMWAFIDETRDWYSYYRGEWGLLSFMIVCSMTVGASNTTGWARFLGTIFGAIFSVVNWNLSRGNAVALAALGALVAFWNFYLIVARGKAPLGRMTLLAYNVSTLYAYSLSQKLNDDNDEGEGGRHPLIIFIAEKRAMSVLAGILWGLIVCRLIWPISARQKFKEGLSMLYLQMGLIWRRGPLAILLRSDCTQSYLRSGEQDAMQRYADRLEALRQAAASEFELRGPFPLETCGRIMRSTNRILDGFYAMSLVTQLKGHLTPGERALLQYTAPERAVLCDRMCHVFQVLASSMMLEYPLTDAVPSVDHVRDRLLSKIFEFRNNQVVLEPRLRRSEDPADSGLDIVAQEKDYALLYAYALVTGQVAEELKVAEREMEGLFGLLNEEALLLQ
ncbi:LOW QUALITY PROTEIN: fructosyl amine:oxygen oxidoreductase [Purpureocillium lavendulum]|uniref:Fructosyl amine:oxygen oxidoreductase n=1 Tax=Purpureocillium lavendulum TaxID=1247861 RepID=A0AB34FNF9_9HYPO|nr:LOW QUALITY PROTEIN: fructosyl amine:oxygen oxidoreductase [Purpureocillium lavendulum]